MKYNQVIKGKFISRPNRFIAHVDVDGREEICHVKNTGRCKEILQPGTEVWLEISDNPNRKTQYSLITARKGDMLINIDSQAPNKLVKEWIEAGNIFSDIQLLKAEYTFGKSRFDFYAEADGEKHLIEVKGVTLENNGHLSFPDAPTERGAKHLTELAAALKLGYKCHVVFVIQMEKGRVLTSNRSHDPKFADCLKKAYKEGVEVHTIRCKVTPDEVIPYTDECIFLPEN